MSNYRDNYSRKSGRMSPPIPVPASILSRRSGGTDIAAIKGEAMSQGKFMMFLSTVAATPQMPDVRA